MSDFLDRVSASLAPGDHFLVGIDLVKNVRTLEAAYNDRAGVSAAFTRNYFARMNRELGTDLDLGAIEHVAYYNQTLDRIEIFARFTREAVVALPGLGRRFRIGPGEMILTEISRKFQVDEMAAHAARFGFEAVRHFTDPTKAGSLTPASGPAASKEPGRLRIAPHHGRIAAPAFFAGSARR